MKPYTTGDWVVYTREKYSPSPGPRAKNVSPAPHGELYSYEVDKFWAVRSAEEGTDVVLETRRGKTHVVTANDPKLRHARWWEKWLYRNRFPSLSRTDSEKQPASNQRSETSAA